MEQEFFTTEKLTRADLENRVDAIKGHYKALNDLAIRHQTFINWNAKHELYKLQEHDDIRRARANAISAVYNRADQDAMGRFGVLTDERLLNAAVLSFGPESDQSPKAIKDRELRRHRMLDDAMALCGSPSHKFSERSDHTDEELEFLSLFI